jgi:hypothetical protein
LARVLSAALLLAVKGPRKASVKYLTCGSMVVPFQPSAALGGCSTAGHSTAWHTEIRTSLMYLRQSKVPWNCLQASLPFYTAHQPPGSIELRHVICIHSRKKHWQEHTLGHPQQPTHRPTLAADAAGLPAACCCSPRSCTSCCTVGTASGSNCQACSGSMGTHTLPVLGCTQKGACGSDAATTKSNKQNKGLQGSPTCSTGPQQLMVCVATTRMITPTAQTQSAGAYLEQVVHLLGHLSIQARVGVCKHNVLQALEQVVLLEAREPPSLQVQGQQAAAAELVRWFVGTSIHNPGTSTMQCWHSARSTQACVQAETRVCNCRHRHI